MLERGPGEQVQAIRFIFTSEPPGFPGFGLGATQR